MKKITLFFGLIAFLVSVPLSACKTAGGTGGGPDIGAGVGVLADCGKKAVAETAKNHLTEVEANLLVDDWKDQLIAIASDIGEEALSCIVDHIIGRSQIDVRASKDPIEQLKIDRGQEWLVARKVTFVPPVSSP